MVGSSREEEINYINSDNCHNSQAGRVVVVVFSSYNVVSAYAVNAHQLRFCFTTTDAVVLGVRAQSFGACKKTEDVFVSQGYTIAEPCHKV